MYREVTMFEVTEALRLWVSGTPKKRIAAQLGLDLKTVRHYVTVGTGIGLPLGAVLTEEHVRDVLLALQPSGGRPRGDTWSHCVAQREAIERWLRQGVRLSKIRRLLARTGVAIPSDAASVRGPGAAVWPHGVDDPRGGWKGGGGAASRYGLGGLAHTAPARAHPATVSRVDLHGRLLALPVCVSDVRGNDRAGD